MDTVEFTKGLTERIAKLTIAEEDKPKLTRIMVMLAEAMSTGKEEMPEEAMKLVDELTPEGFTTLMSVMGRIMTKIALIGMVEKALGGHD